MITENKVFSDYKKLLDVTENQLNNGNMEYGLRCLAAICHIHYHTAYKLVDHSVETLLKQAVSKIADHSSTVIDKNIVFIDYFGLDNKGLTEQYLLALSKLNVNVLYVHLNYVESFKQSRIYKKIESYDNFIFFSLPKNLTLTRKIKILKDRVDRFSPSKFFIHASPWDVVSIALCHLFPRAKKYNINITDHAFWLGVAAFDYVVNFRVYGAKLNVEQKSFSINSQLIIPMYPVINAAPLAQLPINVENKVLMVSGGNYYKVYSQNNRYFDLLKKTLLEHDEIIFFYMGSGNAKPFQKFIEANNLSDRVYLLGPRIDFFEVIKKADIYLGTYPVNGGLMTLYSALAKTPFIAYTNEGVTTNKLLELLVKKPKNQVLFNDISLFQQELGKLVKDDAYRLLRAVDFGSCVISKEEFKEKLSLIIENKERHLVHQVEVSELGMDQENHFKKNIELDNRFFHKYDFIAAKHLKFYLLRYDILLAIKLTIKFFTNRPQS